MDTISIALSETEKKYVQTRANDGGYSSIGEYVRDLIRADQQREIDQHIDTLLLDGLDSGRPIPVSAAYWQEKKHKLSERLSKNLGQPE